MDKENLTIQNRDRATRLAIESLIESTYPDDSEQEIYSALVSITVATKDPERDSDVRRSIAGLPRLLSRILSWSAENEWSHNILAGVCAVINNVAKAGAVYWPESNLGDATREVFSIMRRSVVDRAKMVTSLACQALNHLTRHREVRDTIHKSYIDDILSAIEAVPDEKYYVTIPALMTLMIVFEQVMDDEHRENFFSGRVRVVLSNVRGGEETNRRVRNFIANIDAAATRLRVKRLKELAEEREKDAKARQVEDDRIEATQLLRMYDQEEVSSMSAREQEDYVLAITRGLRSV